MRAAFICITFILASSTADLYAAEDASKPNLVFIYADDMGYGDCTVYDPESKIPTPNIDQLAKDGLRFTDAHSPHATCTASRYGLLTGICPDRGIQYHKQKRPRYLR